MNNQKKDKRNISDSWLKIKIFQNSFYQTCLRLTYLEYLKQRYVKNFLLIQADLLANKELVNDKRQHYEPNVYKDVTSTVKPEESETTEIMEAPETPETTTTPEKHNIFKNMFKKFRKKEKKIEEEKEEKEVDGFVWVEDPSQIKEKPKNSLKWKVRKYFLQDPDMEKVKPENDSDYMLDDFVVIEPETLKELHTESKCRDSFIDFTAGSIAGIAQVYVSQPLDTVKVKLQTYPTLYRGMFNCFMHTYRQSGVFRGLYAGTVPAVVASVAENSVLFTAYSGFQNIITFVMEIDKVCELSVLANACAGSMAAIFSTLTLCPTELVKCKLQAIQETKEYVKKESKVAPMSAYKLTKDIYLREGISGFYRGLTSTFVREIPGVFIFFGSYEASREYLREPGQSKDDIGAVKTMCAGAIGGITLWTVTFPADVIKSRTQIYNLKGTMASVGLHILRQEGISAFYRGLMPSILKTIPSTATLFLVYENVKKSLVEHMHSQTEIE